MTRAASLRKGVFQRTFNLRIMTSRESTAWSSAAFELPESSKPQGAMRAAQ